MATGFVLGIARLHFWHGFWHEMTSNREGLAWPERAVVLVKMLVVAI